jgi:hypothetical protein
VAAQDASVIYMEGSPEKKGSGGTRSPLQFGSGVQVGDSVLTGARDFVELEQGSASTIRVNPNTVFTLQERESEGERESVLKTAAGSVQFKFEKLVGRKEPTLGTDTVVAGVRGTELTVYAGTEGSSLFLVESGEVAVHARQGTVTLGPKEAVEVSAGGTAGEKFEWPGRELDFSTWNKRRLERFLENPVEGAKRIRDRLQYFQEQIRRLYPQYLEGSAKIRRLRDEMDQIEREEGRDAALEFYESNIAPIAGPTRAYIVNTRYYALSALSMRRFVLGRVYMHLKTDYIKNPKNETFQEFLEVYNDILTSYGQVVSPRLVDADI